MNLNNSFLADIGYLSVSTFASRIMLFSRDILLASILGPIYYGIWTQVIVFFNYILHLPFGFQHLLSRDVPFYLAEKNNIKVKKIQDTAFYVSMFAVALTTFLLIILNLIFNIPLFNLSIHGITIISLIIIAQQLNAFYSVLLRAHQKFIIFSIGSISVAFFGLILGLLLTNFWGIIGMLYALLITLISVNIYWANRSSFDIRKANFDFSWFRKTLKTAISLFSIGFLGIIITSIDRLTIVFFYDNESIGYYGFAFIITQAVFLAITPIMQAIQPRMMQSYNHYKKPADIRKYLFFLTQVMSLIVILLVGVIYLIIGQIIITWVPKFSPSLEIIHILLIGSVFLSIAHGANTFLVAINKQHQVLLINVFVIALQIILMLLTYNNNGGIREIAQCIVITSIVYSTLSLILSHHFASPNGGRISLILNIITILSYSLALILIIDYHFLIFHSSLISIAKGLFFWLLGISPLFLYSYRTSLKL